MKSECRGRQCTKNFFGFACSGITGAARYFASVARFSTDAGSQKMKAAFSLAKYCVLESFPRGGSCLIKEMLLLCVEGPRVIATEEYSVQKRVREARDKKI